MKWASLDLRNFQGHKSLRVKFSDRITTIVGPSDVGKSAILRALRWLCLNDLSGDEFIRYGEKFAEVVLGFEDDTTVTRRKGSSTNLYSIDEEEFKAFGQGVPDSVTKLLNVSELNFQAQHDAPFWFAESAPEVSRQLNAIIDLSVIDSALAYVAGEVRRTRDEVGFVQGRLEKTKADLAELEPQRRRIKEFKRIKELHEDFTATKSDRDQLDELTASAVGARAKKKQIEEQNVDRESLLLRLKAALDSLEQRDTLFSLLTDVETFRAAKAPPDFAPVEKLKEEWEELYERWSELRLLLDEIRDGLESRKQKADRLQEVHDRFHQITKGKECPTCQRLLP